MSKAAAQAEVEAEAEVDYDNLGQETGFSQHEWDSFAAEADALEAQWKTKAQADVDAEPATKRARHPDGPEQAADGLNEETGYSQHEWDSFAAQADELEAKANDESKKMEEVKPPKTASREAWKAKPYVRIPTGELKGHWLQASCSGQYVLTLASQEAIRLTETLNHIDVKHRQRTQKGRANGSLRDKEEAGYGNVRCSKKGCEFFLGGTLSNGDILHAGCFENAHTVRGCEKDKAGTRGVSGKRTVRDTQRKDGQLRYLCKIHHCMETAEENMRKYE